MDHTMKKLLLSSAALLGLTAGALAADLPSRRAAPAPYVAVPVFTWTGFYVGVNAGYGFSDNEKNNGYYDPYYYSYYGYGDNNSSHDGFVGGGQIGYNYQIGSFVVGVEADIQYADLNNNKNHSYYGYTTYPYGYGSTSGGIDWFGTVRGRVGFAWDRLLVYGTGGFAYGGGESNNNGYYGYTGYPYGYGHKDDDIRTGWVAGGGVEYAFTPNITGRIEGLYVSLDQKSNNGYGYYYGTTAAAVAYPYGYDDKKTFDFAVVRAGLNYKFSTY
jgi:outer membrane immunogenic protein